MLIFGAILRRVGISYDFKKIPLEILFKALFIKSF